MRKHTIKRRKRQAVYLSMASAALLFAFIGIVTVDVPHGAASFLNTNERGLWSAVSVLADGADVTDDETWQGDVTEPLAAASQDPPSPLVSMVAVSYQLIKKPFGFSLRHESVVSTRILLAMVNLPLLALFFVATLGCIDRVGCTQWSRYTSAALTCFGTMLLPLSASLNYQLPAATATAVTLWLYLYAADRLESSYQPSPRIWVAAGFTAAMAASFQFFAVLMLVPWLLLFGRLDSEETTPFLSGVALGIAFFVGSWVVYFTLVDQDLASAEPAMVSFAIQADSLSDVADSLEGVSMPLGSVSKSHEEMTAPARVLHSIGGHHGLFSLTPIWLLLPLAVVMGIRFEPTEFKGLAVAVAAVSLICVVLGVAILLSGIDRRVPQIYASQLVWMTPLWLLMITPLIEQFEDSRGRRAVVIALIAISVVSALTAFPSVSAFPWLYHVWPL